MSMKELWEYALAEAVKAIYTGDKSKYELALWEITRYLGGIDAVHLLEKDPKTAYRIFVEE